ncbi:MAG: excisionase family DNA-binding protein [bacterium]|nr:excisionase family DNA-binding protein [bacterium]
MEKYTLSTGKAAKVCGVTPDTVLKWIKKGKVKALRTAGGHFRIDTESLKPFISKEMKSGGMVNASASPDNTDVSYCWEYHSRNGLLKSGCRDCMVFRAKAEKCYLMAGLGQDSGHLGICCQDSCHTCEYFRFINKASYNVIVISDNEKLKQMLKSESYNDLSIEFTCCGYETAMIVQDFHPDYIVIDDSMEKFVTEEISEHLVKDQRVHGAQIILAVNEHESQKLQCDGICASIKFPFNVDDLNSCFSELRLKMLGANN